MDERRYVSEVTERLSHLKALAERAVAQMSDAEFFRPLDRGANSAAVLMKHVAGNMRSRWTDFLTTDGEKPDRQRDREFVIEASDSRSLILERWESAWRLTLDTIDSLTAEQLDVAVRIRGEPLRVTAAILWAVSHYAYHVGQIVLIAKHYAGERWKAVRSEE